MWGPSGRLCLALRGQVLPAPLRPKPALGVPTASLLQTQVFGWWWNSSQTAGYSTEEKSKPSRKPLKKPKTPQGRLDEEQPTKENDPLQGFPGGINPITKERGGPKGPEPTRYGDWERKGRCIDF